VNFGWKRRFDEPMSPSRALQTATKPEGVAKLYTDLIASPLVKFPPKSLVVPLLQGVYIIYGPDGRVLHVGSTPSGFQGIWQRLRDHLHKASTFTMVQLKGNGAELRKGYGFRCLVVKQHRQRALLEYHAIGHLCPAHLGTRQKGTKPPLTAAMARRIVRLRAGL
jgi:hypothetical protein